MPASAEKSLENVLLDPKSLAGMLENDPIVRAKLRYKEEGKLLRWIKDSKGNDIIGQLTMQTIALNVIDNLSEVLVPQEQGQA